MHSMGAKMSCLAYANLGGFKLLERVSRARKVYLAEQDGSSIVFSTSFLAYLKVRPRILLDLYVDNDEHIYRLRNGWSKDSFCEMDITHREVVENSALLAESWSIPDIPSATWCSLRATNMFWGSEDKNEVVCRVLVPSLSSIHTETVGVTLVNNVHLSLCMAIAGVALVDVYFYRHASLVIGYAGVKRFMIVPWAMSCNFLSELTVAIGREVCGVE